MREVDAIGCAELAVSKAGIKLSSREPASVEKNVRLSWAAERGWRISFKLDCEEWFRKLGYDSSRNVGLELHEYVEVEVDDASGEARILPTL